MRAQKLCGYKSKAKQTDKYLKRSAIPIRIQSCSRKHRVIIRRSKQTILVVFIIVRKNNGIDTFKLTIYSTVGIG